MILDSPGKVVWTSALLLAFIYAQSGTRVKDMSILRMFSAPSTHVGPAAERLFVDQHPKCSRAGSVGSSCISMEELGGIFLTSAHSRTGWRRFARRVVRLKISPKGIMPASTAGWEIQIGLKGKEGVRTDPAGG
jgi:hypothetical protein